MGTDILPPPPIIEFDEDDDSFDVGRDGGAEGVRGDLEATTEIPDWLENEFKEAEDIRYYTDCFLPICSENNITQIFSISNWLLC